MARRTNYVPPLTSTHSKATQRSLTAHGLPINTPLGISTGGRVRHIIMWVTPKMIRGEALPAKDTLCNLFRPGTSLLRMTTSADEQPICHSCLATLEAEVMRGKEAMRGEPDEPD